MGKLPFTLLTETKKHGPNTGARANNTLHKDLGLHALLCASVLLLVWRRARLHLLYFLTYTPSCVPLVTF